MDCHHNVLTNNQPNYQPKSFTWRWSHFVI